MKSSKNLRWIASSVLGGLLATFTAQAALVQVAHDTLTWNTSEVEIISHGPDGVGWNASTTAFEYTVYADKSGGFWEYVYEFDVGAKGISHMIIELSAGLDLCTTASTSDCIRTTSGGAVIFDTFSSGDGNSNPEMPGAMYGVKLTPPKVPGVDTLSATLRIVTDRAPQWGDFYAKDGVDGENGVHWDVAAWNTGFGLTDWELKADDFNAMLYGIGNFTKYENKILRPDTRTGIPPCVGDECEGSPPQGIPEPSSLALLGIGLLGAGLAKRRRRC